MLKISNGLSLPLNAVTQKLAAIGRTGSGKSYFASKLAEEMFESGAQIVILDVVGIWWGLRLNADGKSPGLTIPVFGGLHGDIPLEPTAGKLIADLIVDKEISCVLDVSQFEADSDKARFATDFGDRFYFRKKSSASAVHIFIEECQEIIPQNIQRGEERMLHAWQRMIRLGRNFGIGATLITQRPQDVNKKALNQAECVFAFQLTGPQERKAIDIWMSDKGLDLDLASDLPKLNIGEAHVWSPSWLKISKTVKIGKKSTFNASSTPEVGRHTKAHDLAKIDLESLHEQIKATIEKAKAEDPKELKKKISELEKQLKFAPQEAIPNKYKELYSEAKEQRELIVKKWKNVSLILNQIMKFIVEISTKDFNSSIPKEEIESAIRKSVDQALNIVQVKMDKRVSEFERLKKEALRLLNSMKQQLEDNVNVKLEVKHQQPFEIKERQVVVKRTNIHIGDINLGRCEREIIKFLAMRQGKFFNKTQVGVMTGYSPNSGGFNNALSKLNTIAYIAKSGSNIGINDSKIDEIIEFLGSDYNGNDQNSLEQWLSKLGKCEREIYQHLLSNPEVKFSKEELGTKTGYSHGSGGFNNAISKLNTLGLLLRQNGMIALNPELLEI